MQIFKSFRRFRWFFSPVALDLSGENFNQKKIQKIFSRSPFNSINKFTVLDFLLLKKVLNEIVTSKILKVGGHEKNNVLEISFKYASRGVERVGRGLRVRRRYRLSYTGKVKAVARLHSKARTTSVRRVTLSVVHRHGRMHTLAPKIPRKISCPPTFKPNLY
ncbi:Protein CBG26396 [Caenorhabditis briggsae]|uniref:Protein CBG26396 n=1 Tax=Caenorhabditis briggsae TaxID=6238 RepID=B6IFF5_CAEBR|nr:Protein CBG26396 [Caenorhabditis briggsae]CAR98635.1 Protein CBG26396 [Caenorhabditis briggsae]